MKKDVVQKTIETVGTSVLGAGIDATGAILNSIFGPSKPEPKEDVVCVCHPKDKE